MGKHKCKPRARGQQIDLSKYDTRTIVPVKITSAITTNLKWFPFEIWLYLAKFMGPREIAGMQLAWDIKRDGVTLYEAAEMPKCDPKVMFVRYFVKKIDFVNNPQYIHENLFDRIVESGNVDLVVAHRNSFTATQVKHAEKIIKNREIEYIKDHEFEYYQYELARM